MNSVQTTPSEITQAVPHTSNVRGIAPCIINGFIEYVETKIHRLAITTIDATNFHQINHKKFIGENRLIGMITDNGNVIRVLVHPEFMVEIQKYNAYDLITREEGDEDFLLKTGANIESLETHENYIAMVSKLGFADYI